MYEEVKDGLIRVLSKVKDIDIFFEPNEDIDEAAEYFFVMLKPIMTENLGKDVVGKSYLIDIRYYLSNWNYLKYMAMAEIIEASIRPVISCKDFSLYVNETEVTIVDKELHVRFSVDITYKEESVDTEEKMEKLDINI